MHEHNKDAALHRSSVGHTPSHTPSNGQKYENLAIGRRLLGELCNLASPLAAMHDHYFNMVVEMAEMDGMHEKPTRYQGKGTQINSTVLMRANMGGMHMGCVLRNLLINNPLRGKITHTIQFSHAEHADTHGGMHMVCVLLSSLINEEGRQPKPYDSTHVHTHTHAHTLVGSMWDAFVDT